MKTPNQGHAATAALVIATFALVASTTGLADAARRAVAGASTKPRPFGLLLLGKNRKFAASAIPKVRAARNADRVGGMSAQDIAGTCPATSVDLGSWCLQTSPFPLTNVQAGQNNYFFASQQCVQLGGYLPTAAQLIGAATRVKLESTIHDSVLTATVQQDRSRGLKDQREMSATLVTTAAGSDAAGSQGVSDGATGDPRQREPNPTPFPATPSPSTLQYVTVYSNATKGGFAGSEPVGQPENFRCAFNKSQGGATSGGG